jgi:hypothetical protein
MAHESADLLPTSSSPSEAPHAPLAGTRSQSIQRLQVGLFGLAAMVLLVALANIILTNAEQNQATVVPEAVPTEVVDQAPVKASDPLAEAGVVPDMPAETPAATQPAEGNAIPPQP